MSHPQPRRLAHFLRNPPSESSFSSSLRTPPQHFSLSDQTSAATTTHSFFRSKFASITTPSCFNVSSRRWACLINLNCNQLSFMDSRDDLSAHAPAEIIRKKKLSGQKRREKLEREVSMLQKLLNQEKQVHEILEHVHHRNDGSTISIPKILPPKTRELLAELAMVESEIGRLEGQISQLQIGLKHEQEATKETKSKQLHAAAETLTNSHTFPSNTKNIPSPMSRSVPERMVFETKTLHFISKAIKGDYNLNDFTLNKKKMESSKGFAFGEEKENQFREAEAPQFRDKVPKKSGMLKPSTPTREIRHPSPKPRERDNSRISIDLPPKSPTSPIQSEENMEKLQGNKLSENIMKCLNFIYVRLLRTSRAMELERSGPISRTLHSSLSSISFRAETALNSKSNPMLQKELRQQDPYYIFNVEESIPRDIGPYKNLVIFTSSSLEAKYISNPSFVPLLQKLRILMNNLQTVDLGFLNYQQKLAFWINMYNACIMHGFLQYGVPSTPEKLLALMNKATLNIGGNTINAQAIEHFILRKAAASSNMKDISRKGEKDEKEGIVRKLYGLESTDPNITFALCCGTCSSPAVRVYTAEGVVAELEKSKLEYLQASIVVTNTKRIAFPELLLRNMHDFAVDRESLAEWVCHQLPTSGTLRKSLVDCFRRHSNGKISATIVEKIPYDFDFRYLLAI